jgi:hypothetical protein
MNELRNELTKMRNIVLNISTEADKDEAFLLNMNNNVLHKFETLIQIWVNFNVDTYTNKQFNIFYKIKEELHPHINGYIFNNDISPIIKNLWDKYIHTSMEFRLNMSCLLAHH